MGEETTGSLRPLFERWVSFLTTILDPWTLILLLSAAALVYGSFVETDKKFGAILTVAATICSGVVGGLIASKWGEHTERQVLVARGRSAIRNLRLLLSSVGTTEKRVETYVRRLTEPGCNNDLVKTYLEEVLERCTILHDEAISAVENWTDIIPDITTQIGKIGELQSKISADTVEISALRDELKDRRDRSETANQAAEVRLRELQRALEQARTELDARRSILGEPYVLVGGHRIRIAPGGLNLRDSPTSTTTSTITVSNQPPGEKTSD